MRSTSRAGSSSSAPTRLRRRPNEALGAARSGRVLVYCTQAPGFRSLLSAQTLASMGYERVEALDGGLVAWEAAGLPVER